MVRPSPPAAGTARATGALPPRGRVVSAFDDATLMAKIARAGTPSARTTQLTDALGEVAASLDALARAQDEARSTIGGDEPNYAVAFEQLFVAVARLNPLYAALAIRSLAQPSVS